ncbi:hypothetical protein CTAYLR_010572 [Chrysophaeum taylorii]|uniref:Uncharacterized protein n=1 Tax=Chrysophaeum taylorii TaxID=2483200 RepID=A0AAD7XME8_9STRA|nr:hypothetical protein CTAYLR_010572 [Chrysophaeum taylorii]
MHMVTRGSAKARGGNELSSTPEGEGGRVDPPSAVLARAEEPWEEPVARKKLKRSRKGGAKHRVTADLKDEPYAVPSLNEGEDGWPPETTPQFPSDSCEDGVAGNRSRVLESVAVFLESSEDKPGHWKRGKLPEDIADRLVTDHVYNGSLLQGQICALPMSSIVEVARQKARDLEKGFPRALAHLVSTTFMATEKTQVLLNEGGIGALNKNMHVVDLSTCHTCAAIFGSRDGKSELTSVNFKSDYDSTIRSSINFPRTTPGVDFGCENNPAVSHVPSVRLMHGRRLCEADLVLQYIKTCLRSEDVTLIPKHEAYMFDERFDRDNLQHSKHQRESIIRDCEDPLSKLALMDFYDECTTVFVFKLVYNSGFLFCQPEFISAIELTNVNEYISNMTEDPEHAPVISGYPESYGLLLPEWVATVQLAFRSPHVLVPVAEEHAGARAVLEHHLAHEMFGQISRQVRQNKTPVVSHVIVIIENGAGQTSVTVFLINVRDDTNFAGFLVDYEALASESTTGVCGRLYNWRILEMAYDKLRNLDKLKTCGLPTQELFCSLNADRVECWKCAVFPKKVQDLRDGVSTKPLPFDVYCDRLHQARVEFTWSDLSEIFVHERTVLWRLIIETAQRAIDTYKERKRGFLNLGFKDPRLGGSSSIPRLTNFFPWCNTMTTPEGSHATLIGSARAAVRDFVHHFPSFDTKKFRGDNYTPCGVGCLLLHEHFPEADAQKNFWVSGDGSFIEMILEGHPFMRPGNDPSTKVDMGLNLSWGLEDSKYALRFFLLGINIRAISTFDVANPLCIDFATPSLDRAALGEKGWTEGTPVSIKPFAAWQITKVEVDGISVHKVVGLTVGFIASFEVVKTSRGKSTKTPRHVEASMSARCDDFENMLRTLDDRVTEALEW